MNFNQDKPIFIQISEMLENQILDGLLKPEDQTPSTNDFQKVYQINPATARKGLNILVDEGILYKKRGMGMYVSEDAMEKIISKREREFFLTHIPELVKEINRLNIPVEKLIMELKKLQEEENDKSK